MTEAVGTTRFAVVGSGWRTGFFLRVAQALPEQFTATAVITRSKETGVEIEEQWGVDTFRSLEDLPAAARPDFVVVSVPPTAAPGVIRQAVGLGYPVLAETPPGGSIEALEQLYALVTDGAVIQVAEQYHLSPLLSAQISLARSGRIGAVSQALVAQCHDYHGVSVIRRALGIGFEDAEVNASSFRYSMVKGPTRAGDPATEEYQDVNQISARLDFGGRLGVYEFAPEQYRSWIRSNRLLVRGDRGEIKDSEIRSLQDFRTPMFTGIRRVSTGEGGNMEGHYLRGLVAGDQWVYRNRFAPARLFDDEIAVATCLARMKEHIDGGPELYSLAEAAQDFYLSQLIRESARTGRPVQSEPQVWAQWVQPGQA